MNIELTNGRTKIIDLLHASNFYKLKYQDRIYIVHCESIFTHNFNENILVCTFKALCYIPDISCLCEFDEFPVELPVELGFLELKINLHEIQEVTFIADATGDYEDYKKAFNKAKELFYQIKLEGKENLIY